MVSIAKGQKDFNMDMQAYLDRRLQGSSSTSFFKKVDSLIPRRSTSSRVPRVDDNSSTVYEDGRSRKSFFWFLSFKSNKVSEAELEEIEEELEDVDEEVEELEDVREGLLTRFFRILRGGNRRSVYDDEDGDIDPSVVASQMGESREALENETRAVLKLIHKWLGKLPPEQITAFRRSPDFNRYKDLLDKYGLIK